MALRNITTRGDEILAKKCKPVREITPRIKQACEDMIETMKDADGVGIAAPQIGIMKRFFIAMPHVESDDPEIRDKIGIPILEMPDETAKLLKLNGIDKAGVLATDGTLESGVYEHTLERYGIQTICPNEEQQKLVMSLIYDYIKKGVTDVSELPCTEIRNLVGDLGKEGAEVLLLACTELPIAFSIMGLRSEVFVDPTMVLAKSAIRMAGAHIRGSEDY